MLKLRRIVSSESWVPEIDGMRFVAIFSVLLFHCTGEVVGRGDRVLNVSLPRWFYLVTNFDRGVVLFFVISGFVLARPFYRQHRLGQRRVTLSQYFLRRLTRLEPPYLLCLLLYMVTGCMAYPAFRGAIIQHTAVSALYIHQIVYPHEWPTPNFVTWSLEIEVQFYLIAPLLGQVYRIPSRVQRRAVWVGLVLLGCLWSGLHTDPPSTLLTYAGFFPAGFLLADIFDDPDHKFAKTAPLSFVWDVVGLLFWAAVFSLPPSLVIRSWLPLVIVPAFLCVFRGRVLRWLFSWPLLTTIGGMCYSIYLLHPRLMTLCIRLIGRWHVGSDTLTYLVHLGVMCVFIVACSTVYFVLIERPCMRKRWPQELWARLSS